MFLSSTILHYELIDPDMQIASEDFRIIELFLQITKRTQIGWHYISDITWIYSHIKNWPRDFKILDAGGGAGGPVQFLMAELGFHVTNIDLTLSAPPSFACQNRYHCAREQLQSFKNTGYGIFLAGERGKNQRRAAFMKIAKTSAPYKLWSSTRYNMRCDRWKKTTNTSNHKTGTITWLQGNLCDMPEIPNNTFDAVVSLSALEHIPLENLKHAVAEIKRVTKADARWAVTTSSTEKERTWFHEPSQSNCFALRDLEIIFEASPHAAQDPQRILEKYQNNRYLKENLAKFYFESEKYGMPWGKWDPQYILVGIFK